MAALSSLAERQRQEREHLILEAARRVFAARGFERANLDDVAREVGIARGTIYRHFPTKEALLEAAVRQGEQEVIERLHVAVAAGAHAPARLRAVAAAMVDLFGEQGSMLDLLNREADRVHALHVHGQGTDPLLRFVAEIIREGQATGTFRRDLDPDLTAHVFLHMLTPHLYREARAKGLSPDELASGVASLFIDGLREVGRP